MKHRGLAALVLLGALAACGGGPASDAATPLPAAASTTALPPGAPTRLVATPGNASIALAFTPPASGGSSPVTGYRASCRAGAAVATASGPASPLTVEPLGNGTAYSCRVAATNAAGTGAASSSVRVTPADPWPATGLSALRQRPGAGLSKIAG